jgi:hypothetical protein
MNVKTNLPDFFKPLFWSYNFSKLNPEKDIERIVINSINYGDWKHWQWLVDFYGKEKLKEIVENIPESEFRKRALYVFSLILGIKEIKHASRGNKIRAERNIR